MKVFSVIKFIIAEEYTLPAAVSVKPKADMLIAMISAKIKIYRVNDCYYSKIILLLYHTYFNIHIFSKGTLSVVRRGS